jgi:hypothetical protein
MHLREKLHAHELRDNLDVRDPWVEAVCIRDVADWNFDQNGDYPDKWT